MSIHRNRLNRGATCTRIENLSGPAQENSRAPWPARLRQAVLHRLHSDQGDVPGWVLITLMTSAIVVGLWAVASEQILQLFNNAMAPFLEGKK